MQTHYPTSFGSLQAWAKENSIPPSEARVRFAQYGILCAIASSRHLGGRLVFKGGNALDFVWQSNRSTRDLDFSVDMAIEPAGLPLDVLQEFLPRALMTSTQLLGIMFRAHRINKQPPNPSSTFITYSTNIGYALQDEHKLRLKIENGIPTSQVIPLEISLNEVVCGDEHVNIDATHQLRVSTIEDIVAEKLRALLQQPIRNRTRRQDLLDIAVILQTRPELDRRLVGEFLIAKARVRNVPVSRAAFHDKEVAERASQDYEKLSATSREIFVPFEEALQNTYDLVDSLDIPTTDL